MKLYDPNSFPKIQTPAYIGPKVHSLSGDLILTICGMLSKINILGRYKETPSNKRHTTHTNFASPSL